jgi:hypothetical protein
MDLEPAPVAFGQEWEQSWRAVLSKETAIKLARKFWPRSGSRGRGEKLNSFTRVLEKLKEEKCFPNDTIRAWVATGAHAKDILWTLGSMKVAPQKVTKGDGKEHKDAEDEEERKRRAQKRQRVDITSPVLGVKGKPPSQVDSQDESEGSNTDDEELNSKVEKIIKKFMKSTSLSVSPSFEKDLDAGKLAVLRSLFPDVVALDIVMSKVERQNILRGFPGFESTIPPALKKDLSRLSTKLSQGEKAHIETLFLAQVRTRDKLRVVLSHMYDNLVIALPLSDQSEVFKSWHILFSLLADDLIWAVKRQQSIILEKHGLQDVISHDARSIIPTELKDRVKEIKDFRRSLNLDNFSRGGGYRGRRYPSRGSNSYRPFRGRGSNSRRGDFHYSNGFDRSSSNNFNRSSSPFHSERDGYRSGGSNSSGRGRGRGRGRGHTQP